MSETAVHSVSAEAKWIAFGFQKISNMPKESLEDLSNKCERILSLGIPALKIQEVSEEEPNLPDDREAFDGEACENSHAKVSKYRLINDETIETSGRHIVPNNGCKGFFLYLRSLHSLPAFAVPCCWKIEGFGSVVE